MPVIKLLPLSSKPAPVVVGLEFINLISALLSRSRLRSTHRRQEKEPARLEEKTCSFFSASCELPIDLLFLLPIP